MIILSYHRLTYEEASGVDSRFWVTPRRFVAHMRRLADCGRRGVAVGTTLSSGMIASNDTALTFDDGFASDLETAAPVLQELGFSATFYVVPDRIGTAGFLTTDGIRQLAGAGFEIGCHSMSHRRLVGVGPDVLEQETVAARHRLEDMLGAPVAHFACPYGAWDRSVAQAVRAAGYASMATSRIGANPARDPFCLERVAVLRDSTPATIDRWSQGRGLLTRKTTSWLVSTTISALGYDRYLRLRHHVPVRDGRRG